MDEVNTFVYLEGFMNEQDIAQITNYVESDNNFKVTKNLSKASYVIYEMDPEKAIYSLPRRRKELAIENMKNGILKKNYKVTLNVKI